MIKTAYARVSISRQRHRTIHFLLNAFLASLIWTACTLTTPANSQNANVNDFKIAFSYSLTDIEEFLFLEKPMKKFGIKRIGVVFVENPKAKQVGSNLLLFGRYLEQTYGFGFVMANAEQLFLKPTKSSNKEDWRLVMQAAKKYDIVPKGPYLVYVGGDKKDTLRIILRFLEAISDIVEWDSVIINRED